MSEPTRAENIRWWWERWVAAGVCALKYLQFPIRLNIEWVGPFPPGAVYDVREEWGERESVEYYRWTFIADDEDREKFGKTEFGDSR